MMITVTRNSDGSNVNLITELSISGTGSTQSITSTPPVGTQGQYYSYQVQTSWTNNLGCVPGLTLFGPIPPGLTYNSLYAPGSGYGTFFGTPTMAGSYTFTLMGDAATSLCAPDATNFTTQTITIAPAATPTTPSGSSNWTRASASPVLTPSASGWDSLVVGAPSVVAVGANYNMYYEGLSTTTDSYSIGMAVSSNGTNWTKQARNPILTGSLGTWDAGGVRYPAVVKNGANYLMIYQGSGSNGTALGLATSTDGISWTKHTGGPVVTRSGLISSYVPGSLLYVNNQYVLFYTVDGSIGKMTSPDAITWTDSGTVFNYSSSVTFSRPGVLFDGTKYRMLYTRIDDINGGTYASTGMFEVTIGYADSPDGATWTTYGNPVFTEGASGAWDRPGVGDASILYDTKFRMWYVGGRENIPDTSIGIGSFVEGSIGSAIIP